MLNKKYIKYGAIAVTCFAVLFFIFIKFYLNNQSEKNNMPYASVQRGDIRVTASGTGTITPSVRKEIMTLSSGIVDKIYAEEGQFVNEGDLILTFDNEAESSVLRRAELNVAIAENSLKELQEELKNLNIYAPSAGFVGDIKAVVGEELSKGYILTTITDKSKMEAIAKFNGTQVKSLNVGDRADILLLASMQTVQGKVTHINKAPGDSDGAVLYEAIVEVDNPGGLSSGMGVQVTVVNDKGTFPAVESTVLRCKDPYDVKLLTGGTLVKLTVSSGEYVEKGQLIAQLENNDLYTQIETQKLRVEQSRLELTEKFKEYSNTAVYAPISGTITAINVTESERVRENAVVAVISDLSNLQVVVPVDELDVTKVKVGQEAVVTVEAMPAKEYKASVSKIALEGSSTGGVSTYDVTLKINETEGLKPGMTANAEIIAEQKENVLLLPVEAIQKAATRHLFTRAMRMT